MSADTAAKNKRYDRQIRIWGTEGQQRLERSRVALLHCGPTGSETLKNLVLGGIASFTIVDGAKVEPRDLGNNFLVGPDSLGQPRAQVVTDLLKEMNESVSGSYVEETPEAIIDGHQDFLDDFDLLIATQMHESYLSKLDVLCRAKGVKLLIVRSYGLVGYLRGSVEEHSVIESQPDSQVDDLRVCQPWAELLDHAMSITLDKLDHGLHKHVPYAVLLVQAVQKWKQASDGKLPSTSKERSAFKESLAKMRRRNADGIALEEENFDEAMKAAFHAWTPPSIPSEVRDILADDKAMPGPSSDDFWVMVAALKAFVEGEGQGTLPLQGSIPDMTATTDQYLQLQRIYRQQADRHVAAVDAHVRAILPKLGRAADAISKDAVRLFCRNARNLRLVRQRSLAEEAALGKSGKCARLAAALADENGANTALYVLLRAADRFHATHGRYPGTYDSDVEDDVPLLKALGQQLLGELGAAGSPLQDDLVVEICRFGASELHVVAAVTGGVAAQEAIKLITCQFVPFPGALIYNAMASTTSVIEL